MATVEISVGDEVFTCPTSWTVEEAKKEIRDSYTITGGRIVLNGIATKSTDALNSDGSFSFVGGVFPSGEFYKFCE
jgi:hypothetical protein